MNGLARVDEVFRNRGERARELKAQRKPVIGYLCTFTPVEIMHAAGVMPFRIAGNMREPITEAGRYLEAIACPFTRSVLDLALKGEYGFLDGFVMPHACDNIVKLYDLWGHNIPHSFAHFVNVPHTQSEPSYQFLEAELRTFQKALERFTGHEISSNQLHASIALYNRQRSLVRRLYEFKKNDPPGITGAETIKTLVATMSLPVEEANRLLEGVIAEIEARKSPRPSGKGPRVMVYGTGNEDTVFIDLVEGLGARVVTDELCFGTRSFWHSVDPSGEPLAMMARGYLDQINCPRTFRQSPGTHEADLQNRFGHIHDMAIEYGAKGIICFFMRYCDTHAFDLPDLKEYLAQKRMPVLVLEEEYPVAGSLDRLKTRLETFIEIIGE